MAKITKYKATLVLPELQWVVDRLAMKRPLYEFEESSTTTQRDHDTQVNTVIVNRVNIFEDAVFMGTIAYLRNKGRTDASGRKPPAFVVESVHIQKRRGAGGEVVTVSSDVALKTAIKFFAPRSLDDVCTELASRTRNALDSASYVWKSGLEDIARYRGRDIMQYIIERHLHGDEIPLPSSCTIDETKLDKYYTFLAGAVVEDAFRAKEGYLVQELRDSSYQILPMSYVPSNSYRTNEQNGHVLTRYRKFEDLPTEVQSRVAVLKIAEFDYPIDDIGVKIKVGDANTVMYIRN
jgi:hypothetical protein